MMPFFHDIDYAITLPPFAATLIDFAMLP